MGTLLVYARHRYRLSVHVLEISALPTTFTAFARELKTSTTATSEALAGKHFTPDCGKP